MSIPLPRAFPSRFGQPVLTGVATEIFRRTTNAFCNSHDVCNDRCCAHGADVDEPAVSRLLEKADEVETFTGIPADDWFRLGWIEDPEVPGKRYTRTAVREGRCVFLNRRGGRGCLVHSFCAERGVPYQTFKPMICCLFPMTFDKGLLQPMEEFHTPGPVPGPDETTVYEASRGEILYYFGQDLVTILDTMQAELRNTGTATAAGAGGVTAAA